MSNPQASPVEVVIDGNTYRMAPLTDRLIGELNNFVRQKVVAVANAAAADMPRADGDRLVDRSLITASKIDFMNDPSIIEEPENALHFIYLAFRKEHPLLEKDTLLQGFIKDPEALDRCTVAFQLLQPMGNLKAAGKPNPKSKGRFKDPSQKTTTNAHSRKSKKKERQNRKKNRKK